MALEYPTKKSNTERQKKINAKIKEIDKKRNDQIKKLNAQNEKFLKESRSKGYLPKKYQTPTELKASKKRTQKLDAQTADEVGSKKMKPVSKKAKDDYKFDQLIESLTGKKGKGKVMKKNMGGSLKAVNNPGLAKLPTPVRNKMGYAKGGGKVEYKMGGGKVMGYKKGGKVIKTNMSGDDVVRGCYD